MITTPNPVNPFLECESCSEDYFNCACEYENPSLKFLAEYSGSAS